MARRKKLDMPKPELNITSMMDLVLNLLTFFVLVSNFAAASLPQLNPPDPAHSKAVTEESPNMVTLNIIPYLEADGTPSPGHEGIAKEYKFGASEVIPTSNIGELGAALTKEIQKSKDVQINLRADRSLHYDQISPVMALIKSAGISRVNVVAAINDSEPGK